VLPDVVRIPPAVPTDAEGAGAKVASLYHPLVPAPCQASNQDR